jgi:hypothetical protein
VGQRAAAFHSLTPSLPHSMTPSLPHSLTPSLPHSLSSSKYSPISGLFVDNNDCEWNGPAVSLQWGGGWESAEGDTGRKGSLDKPEFIEMKRGGMGGGGLVDHAVSAEEDIGYRSRSASNTPCYSAPEGPLIHTQQVLGLSPTVKTAASSLTSRADGSNAIATPTPRSASRTPRNLTLQEIIHSGSTGNWDDLVLGSIGFAPDVLTYDADYDKLCCAISSAASSPRKHYHPDAGPERESEGEGKREREDDPIGGHKHHGVGGGGGKEGERRGTELVRVASPLVLSWSSGASSSSGEGGKAAAGGVYSSENAKSRGVQGMKRRGGNLGGTAAVAFTWARASEEGLQVVPI